MGFLGLKKKSIQKFFNKEIVKRNHRPSSEGCVKTVGVLVEASFLEQENFIEDLALDLGLQVSNIKMFVYNKSNKKEESPPHFTEKDFGWFGSLKLNSLNEFVKNELDLLINYSLGENLYLNTITLLSQAKFKVGFANIDDRLFDLVISVEGYDTSIFNKELKKYLKILNKLECKN